MTNHSVKCLGVLGLLALAPASASAQQWGDTEKLADFVSRPGNSVVTNARAIESGGLMSSTLPTTPWSSTFWPDVKGSIADPYAETGNGILSIKKLSWGMNRNYVMGRTQLHHDAASLTDQQIANMAPSEKYDMLVGDTNFTLTNRVVQMVEQRNSYSLLATWSGVCHGWSPASLTMPRPEHWFSLRAPNGRAITFYPSDVKALQSFLWGKSVVAQSQVKVDGWKCQSGAHTTKFGRLTDPRCFNANPAFFHLVAVNQVGLNHRGFVMDRSYKAEVQNQPVFAYKFNYYRVSDRHPSPGQSLDRAKVAITSGLWDPYRNFRSPQARSLVGVEATIWYGAENDPTHAQTDDARFDKHKTLKIRYDLELDDRDDIVGGEWREFDDAGAQTLFEQIVFEHPSIVWLVPPGMKAYSVGDFEFNVPNTPWTGNGPVPTNWRQAAVFAASNEVPDHIHGQSVSMLTPQPLARVVDVLVQKSRE